MYENIHVSASTKSPVFEMGSSAVGDAFVLDNLLDYSSYVEELISRQLPVLIYAGEFDAQDGPKTQEYWLRRLTFDGSEDFWSQARQIYWVDSPTSGYGDNDQIVGGYWRSSTYFNYLTVPKAGHFVPANNYYPSFQFFSDYIAGQKLLCHRKNSEGVVDDTLCSTTGDMCTAMNDCHGNGECSTTTGRCTCNEGWKFSDCAVESHSLTDGFKETYKGTGPLWYSFSYAGSKHDTVLGIQTNDMSSDVYVKLGKDSDPNNFDYDMSFKNITNINLSSLDLALGDEAGYSVAMYVSAYNETANELQNSTVVVNFEELTAGALQGMLAAALALTFAALL